jgi:hypothetical protein
MAVSEKSILDKIEKPSLAEELRKERENSELALNLKYSHKEDLENLLKLAEELKEKNDEAEKSIKKWKILRILGLISTTLLTLSAFIPSNLSEFKTLSEFNRTEFIVISAGLSGFLTILLTYNFIIQDLAKQHLADKSALSEVLQLLREISNVIAEQEDWSVLSRAEFRIRLSRFNLEEKSESAFSFFP